MYNNKNLLLSIGLFLVSVAAQAQLSGAYILDPSGGGDFKTFNDLSTALSSKGISGPVVVDAKAGTYTERVTFANIKGISSTNTITIKGDGPANTKLEFKVTSSAERSVVRIENLSYFTFRDIGVKNTGTSYGWGIHVYSTGTQVEHVKLINCRSEVRIIGSTNYASILFNASKTSYSSSGRPFRNCLIDSCEAVGGWTGIMFASNRNSSGAIGNRILNTKVLDYYYYGMYLNSLYGFEVDNCLIDGSSTTTTAVGLQFFNNSTSGTRVVKLTNNVIKTPGRYGIYLGSAQGGSSTTNAAERGLIANNMITMSGTYSDTKGITSSSTYSAYYDIFNNSITIQGNNANKTSACISIRGNYNSIKNNNLAYLATGGNAVPLYIATPITGLEIDYNNYYNNASSILFYIISPYSNLNFKGGGGFNKNSFNVDPNFVSSTDLHIGHTKAFPFGTTSTSVTTDIDGDSRCSFASSIGADQSEYYPSSKPEFKGVDTAFVGSPTTFLNQGNALNPLQYSWSVDGKAISKSFDFTHSFSGTGSYKVTLTTTNCDGKSADSTVTINVKLQNQKPDPDFALSTTIAEINEEVGIQDLSNYGPTDWKYSISPDTWFNPFTGQSESTYIFTEGDEKSPAGKLFFTAPGKYEVCLESGNLYGKNSVCKKDIIEVLYADEMCSVNDGSILEKGVIYDEGGKGPYSANQNCNYHIQACGGDLLLDFTEFELADGDFLRVYDGANKLGEPLWDVKAFPNGFTGSLTGIHLSLRAESGSAYLEFETDNSTTSLQSGFRAEWSVDPKSFTAPKALFTAPDTVCVDATSFFTNESEGSHNHYEWVVLGKVISNDPDVLEETFFFTGSYEVKLRAINCGGIDSISRTVTVVKQAKAARPKFNANNLTPNVGETIDLWNTTTYCFEEVEWSISPSTYQFENGTDEESNNPSVSFTKPGCYDVSLKVINSSGTGDRTVKCFVNVGKYCTPATQVLSKDLGIERFAIDDIDNRSSANQAGYTSYASYKTATLVKGASYNFQLERGGSINNFTGSVWIDLDGDGNFSNSELLAQKANISGKTWLDSVKIPITAQSVVTRMRVQTTSAFGNARACGPNSIGEYEDYAVEILEDNDIPEITLVGSANISLEEGRGFTEPGYDAFDMQSGNITSDVKVTGTVNDKVAGTYILAYNVEDEAGNKAITVSRTVVITSDTTKPELTLIGNAHDTIYVGGSHTDLGAEANDILDGVLTGSISTTSNLDPSKIGIYTIKYSATDSRNNVGTVERLVTVLDTTAPVIVLTGADTVKHEILLPYTDLGSTITDNHDDLTTITVETTSEPNVEKEGEYKYTFCATDQSGNTTCITRIVQVADRTAPTITLRGDAAINHEVNTPFNDPWVLVSDNFTRNVTITTGGTYDGTPDELGTFTIWYYAEDEAGNKDSVSRELTLEDTTPPSITLEGDETVEVERWENFVDPGVTVADNYDAVADIVVTTQGDYDNTQSSGRFYVTYQAEDLSGNKSTILTRIVDVVPPTTGIDDVASFSIDLYPNPTLSDFVVSTEFKKSERLNIVVHDIAGRVMYQRSFENVTVLTHSINTANWNAGNYLVRLSTESEQVVERLSVVR